MSSLPLSACWKSGVVAAGYCLLASAAAPAWGATLTVTTLSDAPVAPPGSLRAAIEAAHANVDVENTIVFATTGTLTLAAALPVITKDLEVVGPGAPALTVSGCGIFRVLEIAAGVTASISGATVADGFAGGLDYGGGILNFGTLSLRDAALTGNLAGGGGGAIASVGELTIVDCTLADNTAFVGGGALFNTGAAVLRGSTLSGNTGHGGGGAIDNAPTGSVTIENSTFTDNFTSSSFASGGALRNAGTASISLSTVARNSSNGGGAGISAGTVGVAEVVVKSSIVAQNAGGTDCEELGGTIVAVGTNLDSDGSCPGFTTVTAAALALGPLASNGGQTQTLALGPGSVAVDTATDCADATGASVAVDQRGVPRPLDGDGVVGARCDVGAFELASAPGVPTLGGWALSLLALLLAAAGLAHQRGR